MPLLKKPLNLKWAHNHRASCQILVNKPQTVRPLTWQQCSPGAYPNGMRSPPSANFLTCSCRLHHPNCMNSSTNKKQANACKFMSRPPPRTSQHQPSKRHFFQLDLVQFSHHFSPEYGSCFLWTGPQSLHVNPPRPHSLHRRGGWSFQLSLARCIRKKPRRLAAGYLVVSAGPKNKPILILPPKKFRSVFFDVIGS